MEQVQVIISKIGEEIKRFGPSRPSLEACAAMLGQLTTLLEDFLLQFPRASAGEERLYELGHDEENGCHLYIVSDAPGVSSPPHEHLAWAIVLGLEGAELNVLHNRTNVTDRIVQPITRVLVGAGDKLVMLPSEVHSTVSVGPNSTYHLHAYGRRLASLPPFGDRVYAHVEGQS